MPEQYTITGTIISPDDVDRMGITVQAYDRDLPSIERRLGSNPQALGEATADAEGRFRITYVIEQFRRGDATAQFRRVREQSADLSFRVFDSGGRELPIRNIEALNRGFGADQIIFNAPPELDVLIFVDSAQGAGNSEYERLVALLAPVIEGLSPAELTDEDIVFLINELGAEQRRELQQQIEWLRRSALLAQDTGLPTEAFYGWGRKDLPAPLPELVMAPLRELVTVLERLIAFPDDGLRQVLLAAIEETIIPDSLRPRIDDIIRQLKRRSQARREVVAQLQDEETGAVLAGYSVTTFDRDAAEENRGLDFTDNEGNFSFDFYTPRDIPAGAPARQFRLEVHTPEGKKLPQDGYLSVDLHRPATEVLAVRVTVPSPERENERQQFQNILQDAPPELRNYLIDRQNIRTFADIRRKGGFHQLADLPETDPVFIRRLASLADLDRISPDIAMSDAFIEKGFDSVLAIADTPPSEFIGKVSNGDGAISALEANRLHLMASAQTHLLNNLLTGEAANRANGFTLLAAEGAEPADGLFPQQCGCMDCEAAVSPAAYLTALLDYALKHIKNNNNKIDLPFLVDTFHQPFAALPADCEAVEKQVRQVRICIEVLRRYLGNRPLADPLKEAALAVAEKDYRFAAYSLLLSKLGTSYEEIRRVRTEPPENRKALAIRLGIDLTEPRAADPPGDELDRLFLDPTAQPPAAHALTEERLETLFGFADTTRDPLSEAAKLGDDQGQLRRWNLNGAVWGHNTDPEGMVYATLTNPAPAVFRVELYQDRARTTLVASGETATASGSVRLAQQNNSRLSGVVEIAYTAGSTTISIAAIPSFLSWQLQHLRTLWTQQDHPTDAYSEEASPKLPIIDPDLIGPDDFRSPTKKAGPADPDRAFDLWLARRDFVDTTLNNLKTDRETNGLTEILTQVLGDPLPDLDGWLLTLTKGGTEAEVKTATSAVEKLGLSVDSFLRLLAIRDIDRLAQSDTRNPKVSEEEWREVYAILTQATKVKHFAAWRTQEQGAGIHLGLEEFWGSLREPQEGDWPPIRVAGQPLIDPEIAKVTDLPEWLAGKEATGLWKARQAILQQFPNDLKTERESNGFDAMLHRALGHPAPGNALQHDLNTLKTDLSSPDETVRNDAIKRIEADLHLTVENFKRLMTIKAQNDQPDPAKKPTTAEWAEIYAMLTPARKVKHEYPAWVLQETTAALSYWKALKARLPRWRASLEGRQAWRQALQARSRRPIIDPTVMGADDLRHKIPGDAAFDLWKDRYNRWTTLRDGLQATREAEASALNGLDKIIEDALGFTAADLEALDQERQAGHGVEKRLEQLNLVNGSFTYLMRMRGLVKAGQLVTDAEWGTVYATLAQAKTRRQAAVFVTEERDKRIMLSSDYFTLPSTLLTPLPFLDPLVPPWLSTWQVRRDWQDTLQSRLDLENAVTEALRNAMSAVEEATLPALRDALVLASDAAGASLGERAEWATARLLIDARAEGCQVTTRVAQAIETMQTLIFALRTGQFKHLVTFPLLLVSDAFDDEWKWLGSYPTWRAAMFVRFYPENVAQPSLLKYQTPVFSELIQSTRLLRLDPEQACALAEKYAEYFADVCSLEIGATCQADTRMYTGEGCDRMEAGLRPMFYMFGRAASGKIYWSAYDPTGASAYGQTPWEEVPVFVGRNVIRIVGAMPYLQRGSGDREILHGNMGVTLQFAAVLSAHIYLFCVTGEAGRQTLQLARLHLDDFGVWEDNLTELPIPPTGFSWLEILPVQTQNQFNPPELIFRRYPDMFVYYRRLNADGKEWEKSGTDWSAFYFMFDQFNGKLKVEAVLRANSELLWFVTTAEMGNLGLELRLIELKPNNQIPGVSRAWYFGKADFKGAIAGPEDASGMFQTALQVSAVYLFWRDSTGSYYRRWTNLHGDEVNNPLYNALSDLIRIAPHSGSGPAGQQLIAYQREKNGRAYYMYQYAESSGRLLGSATVRALPRVLAPLTIPRRLTAAQLQQRRQQISAAFARNADATPAVLTYLREAYYFVPLQLALSLHSAGHYLDALDLCRTFYDYEAQTGPPNLRNIYYGLELDAKLPEVPVYQLAEGWLLDPLNPHSIAATRRYTYTRFTVMAIVKCLVDFADAEFTQDTAESLARARTLYLTALDLLALPELQQKLGMCEDLIAQLKIEPGVDVPPEVPAAVGEIIEDLTKGAASSLPYDISMRFVEDVKTLLSAAGSWDAKLAEVRTLVQQAVDNAPVAPATGVVVTAQHGILKEKHSMLLTRPNLDLALADAGRAAASNTIVGVGQPLAANQANGAGAALAQNPAQLPAGAAPAPPFQFCIPPNPMLRVLRLHAELNLGKLRSCRNIAGIKRELDPYAAPTETASGLPTAGVGGQLLLPGAKQIRPTLYRYATLIERAKQLVQLAATLETSMLSALEKRDAEAYNVLKARQDLEVAQANVRVQVARLAEAQDRIVLAELQRNRAQIQVLHYQSWINAGYLESEVNYLNALNYLGDARRRLVGYASTEQVLSAYSMDPISTIFKGIASSLSVMTNILGVTAINNEIAAQRYMFQADYERRLQEWQLQESLAQQDYEIGEQQIRIAGDNLAIVTQEKGVAEILSSNAKDTIEFLNGKFTNRELYDWMSGVLEGIYRVFLQQATTMAKLAENQLAFERQESVPAFIKTNYWAGPANGTGGAEAQSNAVDRKGLTGSARLLQDAYQLDQYAFDTNKRKLQLTKTLSLARIAPVEFHRFLETGVLAFSTPAETYDRDFPGQYLRLIKRVRTSVIALIPPTRGICATLSTSGVSRVVIGPDIFQTVTIRRDPEFVALTSPANATGLFELDTASTEMLLPFEGNGVDTTWEFRMPKAANPFDYRTIADILITIDYTALNSFDYRQQVIQSLSSNLSADRTFSFRNQFADQWYDLHNPQQTKVPMTVRFRTVREDFPPNIEGLKIQHVLLYFVRADGQSFEVPVTHLRYSALGDAGTVGGGATTIDGIISTQRGNAGSWMAMIGKSPLGEWEMALPNTEEMRQQFINENIDDILLILTYSGRMPPWPA
jgi:hypothetical protein